MKPQIDEEKLQSARVKAEEQYLRMSEARELVKAECDMSSSMYYHSIYETFIRKRRETPISTMGPRVKKKDVLDAIEEYRS